MKALAKSVVQNPEHRQLARVAAQRAAVLLRNEGGLLPLAKNAGSVAVIGPLADSKADLLTMWAGFGIDTSSTVTVVEGVRNKLGGAARIEYAPGVQIARLYPSFFEAFLTGRKKPSLDAGRGGSGVRKSG